MKYGFGVDLGGTTVKIAFFDEMGTLLQKWSIPTNLEDHGSRILPEIAATINDFIRSNRIDRDILLGVGIGVPGSVLPSGIVNRSSNLGWGQFDLAGTFSELISLPVKTCNDANAAALGEFWMGAGRYTRNMVMVTLGTGVGGGIIIDGKLLTGAHGAGAEIGHMVLNRSETEPCSCGKYGCAEQYCSATGLVRMARKALAASDVPSPLRHRNPLTCSDIFYAGWHSDPLAMEILEQFYAYMGEFLANVCILADPEVVVLGGGVSKAGQILITGIQPYFDKYIFHAFNPIRFSIAALGNDAGAYGAFRLMLDPEN